MTDRDKLLKKNDLAGMEIDQKIQKEHPHNDEVAILRKTLHAVIHGEPIPQEFEAYYEQAESVKAEVKERLSETETVNEE